MFASFFGKLNRTSRNTARSRRLELETLEARSVPSTVTTLVNESSTTGWCPPAVRQVREMVVGARAGVDTHPVLCPKVDPGAQALPIGGNGPGDEIPAHTIFCAKLAPGTQATALGNDYAATLGGKIADATEFGLGGTGFDLMGTRKAGDEIPA